METKEFDAQVRSEMERTWARARRAHKRGDWERLARVVWDAGGLLAIEADGGREVVVPQPNLAGLTGHCPLPVGETFHVYLDLQEAILDARFRAEDRLKEIEARSEERASDANNRIYRAR
jgi:hypothetical protein